MRAINLTELDIYTCTQGHLGSLKFILEVSIERERASAHMHKNDLPWI